MPRIAVITHQLDGFWKRPYVLHGLIPIWESWGIEVEVVAGPGPTRDADLAILHVDQTHVPPEYLALAARYPKCINRYTPDISKRFISRQLVARDDSYNGPVIVKSNFNSGGWIEAHKGRGSHQGFVPQSVSDYKVLDRKEYVSDAEWSARYLVVEKFLPEVEAGKFCIRYWHFCGSEETVTRLHSDEPIVRSDNALWRERMDCGVPDELRELRESLGFEYGKFDFGIFEGRSVLYDANRTPGLGKLNEEQANARNSTLAAGIRNFIVRA